MFYSPHILMPYACWNFPEVFSEKDGLKSSFQGKDVSKKIISLCLYKTREHEFFYYFFY